MMFCPKCGSLVVPKKEGGKNVISCSCGYTNKRPEKIEIKEVMKKDDTGIEAIEKEESPYPLTEIECPKCKHKKAHFWMIQTRASDEPETKFFKCEKCKHIWRDYN